MVHGLRGAVQRERLSTSVTIFFGRDCVSNRYLFVRPSESKKNNIFVVAKEFASCDVFVTCKLTKLKRY